MRAAPMLSMIGSDPFVRFFNEEPVFVCSHDGKAVFQNSAADELSERLGKAFCLFDVITSADSVRYEILMNSNKPRSYRAAANIVSEYRTLEITPIDVGDYRMSIVMLLREDMAEISVEEPSIEAMRRLIVNIGASEELTEHLSPLDPPLFDIRTMTGRIVAELTEKENIDLDWIEPVGKSVMPSNIGSRMYTYMLCASLSAMKDASEGGRVTVRLENLEKAYCLKIYSSCGTAMPIVWAKLEFASFIAQNCGCIMESSFGENKAELYVELSHFTDIPNFKSYDQFAEFDIDLEAALRVVDIICREAVRA